MASQAGKRDAQQRRAQIAKLRAEQARKERQRKLYLGIGGGALVAVVVAALVFLSMSKSSSGTSSAAGGSTALAPTWDGLTGQTVGGVSAATQEQLAYHIHVHLAIYVDGTEKSVPAGIGIVKPWSTTADQAGTFVNGGKAIYYLHTHDESGVLHVESPTQSTYTLGQFFAEWNQPLSSGRVGPDQGALTVYVNGAKYTGDPAKIPLDPHAVIQLDLGKPVAFKPYTFAQGL